MLIKKLKIMNYSIEILEKEKRQLNEYSLYWDSEIETEQAKHREKILKNLEDCISILKCVDSGVNPFSESASIYCLSLKTKPL